MNQFEKELRKLFDHDALFDDTKFVGRMCYGKIGDNIRVRAEFVTRGVIDRYEALKVSLINKNEGVIDSAVLCFGEVWGKKSVAGNLYFKDGVSPYMWIYNDELSWYAYTPTPADFEQLSETVDNYLEMFREQTQEMSCGMEQKMK